MDMETFDTFDTSFPSDEELKKKIIEGIEVEYWRILGRTKIVRVKN